MADSRLKMTAIMRLFILGDLHMMDTDTADIAFAFTVYAIW